MDILTNGIQPGTAAPAGSNPHGLALLGTDHRATVAVAPREDAPAGSSGKGVGVAQGQGDRGDCAAGSGDDQAHAMNNREDKPFKTLRARLALAGYSLTRTQAGDGPVTFHASRWGLVCELRDLAAVEAFATRASGQPS